MNPAMLALLISLIEEAVKITPAVVEDFKLIFNNPEPVPADWEALRAKVLAKGYGDYVPASALPPDNVVKVPPPIIFLAPKSPPITDSGAIPTAVDQANPQNPPDPYLPDGSPNPAFNHLGN
ncbi:MAG: hypothetical protein ABSA45_03230 [Verrucomicrobiota bacterium]